MPSFTGKKSQATSTLTSSDITSATTALSYAELINDADSYPTGGAISVPSSGTGDTFGAWTELDASTAAERTLKSISLGLPSANALQSGILEIGVGGSGSESAVIRRAFCNPTSHSQVYAIKVSNVTIASGSRVSARAKDSEASARNYLVMVELV